MEPLDIFSIPAELLPAEVLDTLSHPERLAIELATREAEQVDYYGPIQGATYIFEGHSATDEVCDKCGKLAPVNREQPEGIGLMEWVRSLCYGQAAYVVTLRYDDGEGGFGLSQWGVPHEGKPSLWAD